MAVDDNKILQKVEMPPRDCLTFATKTEIVVRHFTSSINLSNPTDQVIAFKTKTTSPHLIKVFPAFGYMKPKQKAEIIVNTALPLKENPKCRIQDRVSIVLAVAGSKRPENAAQFWHGTTPKQPFRFVFPIKFIDEMKNKNKPHQKEPDKVKEDSYDEKDESTVTEDTTDSSSMASENSS